MNSVAYRFSREILRGLESRSIDYRAELLASGLSEIELEELTSGRRKLTDAQCESLERLSELSIAELATIGVAAASPNGEDSELYRATLAMFAQRRAFDLPERDENPTTAARPASGSARPDFSGMTEDELGDFLEDVKHEMRAERRAAKPRQ